MPMSTEMKKYYEIAEKIEATLKPEEFGGWKLVIVNGKDDSTHLVYDGALAQEYDDWYFVFTEHYGLHIFHKDCYDVSMWSRIYDIPKSESDRGAGGRAIDLKQLAQDALNCLDSSKRHLLFLRLAESVVNDGVSEDPTCLGVSSDQCCSTCLGAGRLNFGDSVLQPCRDCKPVLEKELKYFNTHIDDWQPGDFVLIFAGPTKIFAKQFTKPEEAYVYGVKKFGNVPFLIKQVPQRAAGV